MNRQQARTISDDVRDALEAVARKHGLELTFTGASFDSGTLRPRFVLAEAHHADDEFEAYRSRFGIPAGVRVGTEFTFGGATYRVVGVRAKARKNPIRATDVRSGKAYAFAVSHVTAALTLTGGSR